jgi:hypothetical protein
VKPLPLLELHSSTTSKQKQNVVLVLVLVLVDAIPGFWYWQPGILLEGKRRLPKALVGLSKGLGYRPFEVRREGH